MPSGEFRRSQVKINNKLLRILISALILVVLLLPGSLLAQDAVNMTLTLSPGSYYHEVTAGQDNLLFLEIENTGDLALTNIRLSGGGPADWTIRFTPDRLDYLGTGSLQTVKVNVRPDVKADKGGYDLYILATSNETSKVTDFRVYVERGSFWLWVGGGIAALLAAAFVFIYLRLERQKS
jgi:uncharacterized membrane protein